MLRIRREITLPLSVLLQIALATAIRLPNHDCATASSTLYGIPLLQFKGGEECNTDSWALGYAIGVHFKEPIHERIKRLGPQLQKAVVRFP